MNGGLGVIACAGDESLERALLLSGAVVQAGGTVVLLTHTPGQALSRTFFGLEVIVRHEDDTEAELRRLEALAVARSASVVLLADDGLTPADLPLLRDLAERFGVARYGPSWETEADGELVIDPYSPPDPTGAGCFGLAFLPLHPGLRSLRDGRLVAPLEVARVTILCRDNTVGRELAIHTMETLSVWRPSLQVTVLCDLEMPRQQRHRLDQAIERSRHQVHLRPVPPVAVLGEVLLCDLLIVDEPDRAAAAAYLGTPVVLLSTGAEDARRGEALAQRGALIHVPCMSEGHLPPAVFADLIWSLCADSDRRAALFQEGRAALDGYGAERVTAALFELDRATRARADLFCGPLMTAR